MGTYRAAVTTIANLLGPKLLYGFSYSGHNLLDKFLLW